MINIRSRAAVLPYPDAPPEIRHYDVPDLQLGAVLFKTIASEVCGTDVHLWHGRLAGVPYPLIPGHVSVGTVAATGGVVTDVEDVALQPGDVVTFLDVHGTCNRCWYCLVAKATTRCPHRRVYGITYGGNDPMSPSGGWSEYIYLRPGTRLIRLPENVSPNSWIGGGCGLPTAVHAVELARIGLGDRVLIQGSGPVGLSACALAALSGAGWIGVLGAPARRLEAAAQMGADWTMDVTQSSPEQRRSAVLQATRGHGPDIVIEASGNPQAVPEGCDLARDAGRYIIVGQYTDHGDISLNPHTQINRKHLEIQGCWGSDFSHVYRAMEVMSRFGSRVDWSALISKRYRLDEVGAALADVEAQRVVKAVIVPE